MTPEPFCNFRNFNQFYSDTPRAQTVHHPLKGQQEPNLLLKLFCYWYLDGYVYFLEIKKLPFIIFRKIINHPNKIV
jgi:hypothetical protein